MKPNVSYSVPWIIAVKLNDYSGMSNNVDNKMHFGAWQEYKWLKDNLWEMCYGISSDHIHCSKCNSYVHTKEKCSLDRKILTTKEVLSIIDEFRLNHRGSKDFFIEVASAQTFDGQYIYNIIK